MWVGVANRGPHTANRTCDFLRRYGNEVTDRPHYSLPTSRLVIFIYFNPCRSTCLASDLREMPSWSKCHLLAWHLKPISSTPGGKAWCHDGRNVEMSVLIRGRLVCTICYSELWCIHRVGTKFSASECCNMFSNVFVRSIVLVFGSFSVLKCSVLIPTFQNSFCLSSRGLWLQVAERPLVTVSPSQ